MANFEHKIWFVYRGSESLGPFSASELRAALRLGELDPFEKVGRTSSSVRQNLIDIDEIFNTESVEIDQTHVQAQEPAKPKTMPQSIQVKQQRTGTASLHPMQISSTSAHGDNLSGGYFGGAAVHRDAPSSSPPKDFTENIKPFYVSSKGKYWGPFHAPEIIAEYRKGNIPQRSYVLRNGYKAKLHIQKFVEQYKQRLAARGPQKSLIHPMASNDRKVFVLKSRDPSQWLAIAFIALCILIMSFLAYDYLVKTSVPQSTPTAVGTAKIENVPRIRSTTPRRSAQPNRPPSTLNTPRTVTPPTIYVAPKPVPTQPRRQLQPRQIQTQVPQKKPTPKKTVRISRPVKKRVIKKTIKRSSPASLGSVAGLSSKVGSQVSLGPLSYSTKAVSNCNGKCNIRFRGRNGSFTGVFFKSAYGSALLRQKGRAKVKGRVMGGGKSLLIQDVN